MKARVFYFYFIFISKIVLFFAFDLLDLKTKNVTNVPCNLKQTATAFSTHLSIKCNLIYARKTRKMCRVNCTIAIMELYVFLLLATKSYFPSLRFPLIFSIRSPVFWWSNKNILKKDNKGQQVLEKLILEGFFYRGFS